jgi:putative membrane protein (TIGR04086 family)
MMDWLDRLIENWAGILLGVGLAVFIQVLSAILMWLVGLPMGTPLTLLLTELSICIAGFVAAWMARRMPLINGVTTAVICAFLSLIATTIVNPFGISLLSLLILFGGYSLMGLLGGGLAGFIKGQRRLKR